MQYPNVKLIRNHCRYRIITVAVLLVSVLLAACSSSATPAPTIDPRVIQTQNAQTVVVQVTAVAPPVVTPNSSFQTSWTLQNSGQVAWDKANFNIRFLGSHGVPLHLGSDFYNLAKNVDLGQAYTVTVPMIAPAIPGKYGEFWGFFGGDNIAVCQFWLTIEVK